MLAHTTHLVGQSSSGLLDGCLSGTGYNNLEIGQALVEVLGTPVPVAEAANLEGVFFDSIDAGQHATAAPPEPPPPPPPDQPQE